MAGVPAKAVPTSSYTQSGSQCHLPVRKGHGKFVPRISRLIEDRPRLRYASSRLPRVLESVARRKRSVLRVVGCVTLRQRRHDRQQSDCVSPTRVATDFSPQFSRTNLPWLIGPSSDRYLANWKAFSNSRIWPLVATANRNASSDVTQSGVPHFVAEAEIKRRVVTASWNKWAGLRRGLPWEAIRLCGERPWKWRRPQISL